MDIYIHRYTTLKHYGNRQILKLKTTAAFTTIILSSWIDIVICFCLKKFSKQRSGLVTNSQTLTLSNKPHCIKILCTRYGLSKWQSYGTKTWINLNEIPSLFQRTIIMKQQTLSHQRGSQYKKQQHHNNVSNPVMVFPESKWK